jgi:parallel beta-helix repeat protein
VSKSNWHRLRSIVAAAALAFGMLAPTFAAFAQFQPVVGFGAGGSLAIFGSQVSSPNAPCRGPCSSIVGVPFLGTNLGGTGVQSLPANSLLIGQGFGPTGALPVGAITPSSAGRLLMDMGPGVDPQFVSLFGAISIAPTGQVTLTGGGGGGGGGGSAADERIWVSTAGNDSNPGTSPGLPKLTLQAAVNAANPGGIVYVGAGTYTLSSSLAMQPGVTLQCLQGVTITQANGANLASLINFATNTATFGTIIGCTIDGNRSNNTFDINNIIVNIGNTNNVSLRYNTIQNSTGDGIEIVNGARFSIIGNTFSNNTYTAIYDVPRTAVTQFGQIAENQFTLVGAHAIIIDGGSFNRVHDNIISGTLNTQFAVTVSGTTTVTATAAVFSATCDGTHICPGNFVIAGGSGIFQELFITSVSSSTVATATGGTNVTNASALGGSGDLIDIAALAGGNDVYSNFISGGAGGGIVDADFGDSANSGSHALNSYRGNIIQSVGNNCIVVEQGHSGDTIVDEQILDNRMTDCLLHGEGIYEVASSVVSSLFFSGAGVSIMWVNGNYIQDIDNGGATPFGIAAAGLANSTVSVGKNFISGMLNGQTVGGNASAVVEVP